MSDTAKLTKKEQQELRGAEARISRVTKLQQQLEEARIQASQSTVKKIEDINAQVEKLDERAGKVDEQIAAVQQRKQALIDRRDELVKAKYALADEIAEYLTPGDHERLGLDHPENVTNNTPLTPEQVEAAAESAQKAEAEDKTVDEVADNEAKPEAETLSLNKDEAKAEAEPAKAKPTRSRAKAQ
jgi:uncharacterized protein YdcH (DUF465 family)